LRYSPFIFEDYVPREKFFDRKSELDFFIRSVSVKRKMLLCIVAPLKYGKTSLMMRYLDVLEDFEDIIPIYINLKKKEKPILFIVRELEKSGIGIQEIYEECLGKKSLEPLFDAINNLLNKKGKWLFLLFDEFHLLPSRVRHEGFYAGFSDEDLFGFFRSFAEGARISYVVCGSVIEPLMKALDVWGGRFQMIYLGPFSRDDAVDMLKKLFKEGDMEISEEDAIAVAEAAGYHPFYMQFMGHHIYMESRINRYSLRKAKNELYKFLLPIFEDYFERILSINDSLQVLEKILNKGIFKPREIPIVAKLRRMGIIRPTNADYEFVDPLFRRYIENILKGYKPSEVVVVGHWAERIVGNYLLKRGYIPYYSHDSRGTFDIYVKIKDKNVGIQVKYTSSGRVRLSESEANEILYTARELNWIPIIALVSKRINFFRNIRSGEYKESEGSEDIEELLD